MPTLPPIMQDLLPASTVLLFKFQCLLVKQMKVGGEKNSLPSEITI